MHEQRPSHIEEQKGNANKLDNKRGFTSELLNMCKTINKEHIQKQCAKIEKKIHRKSCISVAFQFTKSFA